MVDYEILDDIPHYGQLDKTLERRYACAGLGLFYVNGSGDIMPIAIQFHQVPSETNPIWTPNDSELDWTCAKMWLRNADTQWHQVSKRALLSVADRFRVVFYVFCHLEIDKDPLTFFAMSPWVMSPGKLMMKDELTAVANL